MINKYNRFIFENNNWVLKLYKEKDKIISDWSDFYSDKEKGDSEFWDYYYSVKYIYEKGGKLYRVLFVDNLKEINLNNLGFSWTISEYDAYIISERNFNFVVDDMIKQGKIKNGDNVKIYLITIETEPNNIYVDTMTLYGNAYEKEVNIKNHNKIKLIDIKILKDKQFRKI